MKIKRFSQGAVKLQPMRIFFRVPFIESCFLLMWKDEDFLALLDGEGGKDSIRLSFLPLDSCRWSRYPFNFPFQSSLKNFLGKLSEVGSSVFLSVR